MASIVTRRKVLGGVLIGVGVYLVTASASKLWRLFARSRKLPKTVRFSTENVGLAVPTTWEELQRELDDMINDGNDGDKSRAQTRTSRAESRGPAEIRCRPEIKGQAITRSPAETRSRVETRDRAETRFLPENRSSAESKSPAETRSPAMTRSPAKSRSHAKTRSPAETSSAKTRSYSISPDLDNMMATVSRARQELTEARATLAKELRSARCAEKKNGGNNLNWQESTANNFTRKNCTTLNQLSHITSTYCPKTNTTTSIYLITMRHSLQQSRSTYVN